MTELLKSIPEVITEEDRVIICKAIELGIADETAVRNYFIRKEFLKLKKDGLKSVQAIEVLMKKYSLKWSRINGIIYN